MRHVIVPNDWAAHESIGKSSWIRDPAGIVGMVDRGKSLRFRDSKNV